MKKSLLIGTSVAIMAVAVFVMTSGQEKEDTATYTPRTVAMKAQSASDALSYRNSLLVNNYTGKVEPLDLVNGLKQAKKWGATHRAKAMNLTWQEMGPDNIGGRTRAIESISGAANKVYVGGVTGGLWYSVNGGNWWQRVRSFDDNNSVSSIAQTGNGRLFVATGNVWETPNFEEGTGSIGNGIYYTDDVGSTTAAFTQISGSEPTVTNQDPTNVEKVYWNRIKADPNQADKLWAGGNGGLWTYTNANGFTEVPRVDAVDGSTSAFGNITDIEICPSGNNMVVSVLSAGMHTHISTDGGATWTHVSNNSFPGIPFGGVGRITYAYSPQDCNYLYAAAATSTEVLKGIYQSTNKGLTWTEIAPGGSEEFDPFIIAGVSNQGEYNNCITVDPMNKRRILVGGIMLWEWEQTQSNPSFGSWEQVAYNFPVAGGRYIHSDLHYFHWDDLNHLYIGTDGGIFKSLDRATSFYAANRGYNVTQNYAIAYSGLDEVTAGTQDNGTYYINYKGNTYMEAEEIFGGDGFETEISGINPGVIFATSQYGTLGRSDDNGGGFQEAKNGGWYGGIINDFANDIGRIGPFYTTIALYDTWNDPLSKDSVIVVVNQNIAPNDTIFYNSTTLNEKLWEISVAQLDSGDTVTLVDPIQSLFAVGFDNTVGAWITRDAMRFSVNPAKWINVLGYNAPVQFSGNVHSLEFSKDGNNLYIGTTAGKVYRVGGLDSVYSQTDFDSLATGAVQIYDGSSYITDITVDPNDPGHVVITTGGFGGSHIFESWDADATIGTSSFVPIDGNLPSNPSIPVYSAVIDRENDQIIIIGTEYGVYATDDGGTTWTDQNATFERVPVFDIRQQYREWNGKDVFNPGMIYLGTHGRGIWKSADLLSARPEDPNGGIANSTTSGALTVYPNPMAERGTIAFNLSKASDVQVKVYDLHGRLVQRTDLQGRPAGEQTAEINVSQLSAGNYVIHFQSNTERRVAKFIKK